MTQAAVAQEIGSLVDLGRLRGWMDAQGLGQGAIEAPRLLAGGTQNVLLRFQRGDRAYVLRRPPRHPRPESNAAMLREGRVLRALAGSDVPHPALVALCEDPERLGTVFFLMEAVEGFNPGTQGLPPLHASQPAIRHRMGLAMVDAIAALGRLDANALGLQDLGRPEGFLQRQVQRWRKQLQGYEAFKGWPGAGQLPDVEPIAGWLEAHRPADAAPGLLHGDFHLSNVMFRHDGGELAAVVDWEMATIGDPLLDLGWLLATWPRPDGTHHLKTLIEPWQGFPLAEELVERYAQRSARDLSAVRWYAVLACYKLAIVLEGTHARACTGLAPVATGGRLHRAAPGLPLRPAQWIEQ